MDGELAVMMSGAGLMVRVKLWGVLPPELAAVMVKEWLATVPSAGLPARVPVALPLSVKVTPPGRVPLTARVGVGEPVVVTGKVNVLPTVAVVLAALVKAGPVPEEVTVTTPAT